MSSPQPPMERGPLSPRFIPLRNRREQAGLVAVVATPIAISSLLEGLMAKNAIDDGAYAPDGVLELSWIVIVLRSIEIPLLLSLFWATLVAKPKLARPWLFWSPIAALAQVMNSIMKTMMIMQTLEDLKTDVSQAMAQAFFLGVALVVGQVLYGVVIWGWLLSTMSPYEQLQSPTNTVEEHP